MNILELSEQEIVRREALAELRNMGIEPYPAAEYRPDPSQHLYRYSCRYKYAESRRTRTIGLPGSQIP